MVNMDPLNDGVSELGLLRTSGSDLDVVNAARVSYGGKSSEFGLRDEKLIFYLLSHGHTSPFEHTHLVYRVKLPIFTARQWMRHRVGVSYNEVSGRYTELPLDFYTPKQWRAPDDANRQGSVAAELTESDKMFALYNKTLQSCGENYKVLLKSGISRELARGVLPLCTYTEFIFTCNLVSLLHFVHLRYTYDAQWEIRQYANGLLKLARPHFPASVDAWERLRKSKESKTIKPDKNTTETFPVMSGALKDKVAEK